MKIPNLRRALVPALLSCVALAGCASQPAKQALAESPVYATPAADLVKRVRTVLSASPISLQAQDLGGGVLLTDWQGPFRGDFHIVRYWHERTRYRISAVPDFTDPAHRSRLQISDETQQRPDEDGFNVEAKTWHDAPNIHRPERGEALLRQIENQLMSPAPAVLPEPAPLILPATAPAK